MIENNTQQTSARLDESNELHSSLNRAKKPYMKPELVSLSGNGTETKAITSPNESSPAIGPS
ncbi:MAG: hypothetical protein M0P91_03880 [Sulfuricurvum sp.]|jgi:hypothetical protein|uniref:hypothetical protein n=1 Tax=Sulfuricurvum sp. TaxID=2025608 RepID=UPI0025E0041B|nr:hypothetical protein [Sulfuricurvum sp.]MCK9372311.1 hypothetical protein [Sulfuricurvum sp.]